ncbi:MAG TPA: fatty acid oxidation complex subunit alpha FadJ [Polyangiaceae bacterium]|jgi:3-hydroxyacyl-CoA dehydrogenase/enoyl-CoA hydratase/3-hydroxybutyryl-CoA epimerase|nr:fatty acid oxidation complex subunit alpha FadJ [Polyangiaceae bacterium]
MPSDGARESLSVAERADGVAVVRFDVPGEPVNTLQADFAAELERVFAKLEQNPNVKAVLLTSGKPDSFVAGADIKLLRAVERAEQASELSRTGQRALAALVDFRVPVVAAIHGACLGGGLELALACSARVASTDEKTKLGLPEVQLGVLPALGGTQRLPRLVGVRSALDLLLTGKQIDGKRALRMGLIDELVPPAILLEVAARLALARAEKRPARSRSLRRLFDKSELAELALADNPLGRKLLFDQARTQLLEKTRGNYPAAERILDVVKLGLAKGLEAGLKAEAQAFGELVVSEEARALMHVFFASTELKKDPGHDAPGVEPRAVHRVAVLGAGLMGAGIAYVSAAHAKIDARLKDRDEPALGKGLKYVREIFDERVEARRLTVAERELLMARVTATTDYGGFEAMDLVIEAVFEDLELKRQVLAEVEAHTNKRVIFASNTSSLPIAKIAEGARRPEQVIGMHYFSPVHKMPLLEVIVTDITLPWVTATCVELGKRQGKTVIVVRDGAGFYTSRILGPYLSEASFLLSEGVPIERIDDALVSWGFPVGPITLLDEVGIDVGAKVGHILHEAFGERMPTPPGVERLLNDQRLGKKNQRGFYGYGLKKKSEKKAVDPSVYALLSVEPVNLLPQQDIAWRCALQLINEACHCFGEGILRSARDGDIGAIFGLGFPPFRGGPFRYIDTVGASEVVRRLEAYRSSLGERFAPAPILLELAQHGSTFYGPKAVAPRQHPG